jgi:Flp pilus assembly protein TadG
VIRLPAFLSRVIKRLSDESGQAVSLMLLSMTCMLGLVGFSVDVGTLLRAKRVMQSAADSAAIAGAAELSFGDVTAAARADAALNGVTNGASGTTVTVNNGPASGPNAGNAKYVEVIVSQSQPTFFMKMLNHSSMMVSARAVATFKPRPNCIYTLSPNPPGGSGIILSSSSAALNASNCGIVVDATGGSAIAVSGGASITAGSVAVVGSISISGSSFVNKPPALAPVTGIAPVSDPLSFLVPPSFQTSSCLTVGTISTSQTLGPSTPGGTVCYNGLSTSGSGTTLTLNPGVYIINGTFTVNSGTTLAGTGVTLYFPNNSSSFTTSKTSTINLTAPAGGAYGGILFYQDPSDTQAMSFTGGTTGSLNGIFYVPTANLNLSGGSTATFNVDLVVGSLTLSGGSNIQPYVPLTGSTPLSTPMLAE